MGSRNAAAQLDREAEALTRKPVESAPEGDPALLRRLDEPEPPPPPRRWRRPDPREVFVDKKRAMAARIRLPPPLAHASVMELFAHYVCGPGARDAPDPAPA
ncbi:MAG: hypothetical protein WB697_06690 [Stellaceae bacterium]